MNRVTFADLFAGIGGFHLGMVRAATSLNFIAECKFAVEIDKHARAAYEDNFIEKEPDIFENNQFYEDIRSVNLVDLPDVDVICGGFPCQAFSQIGKQKGFDDTDRGNLFFYIEDMIREKRPSAIFLENVRNLVNHDDGRTFQEIKRRIEELNYSFHFKVIRASEFGLPQHRPRTYIVGFDLNRHSEHFEFPQGSSQGAMTMADVFNAYWCNKDIGFTLRVGGRNSPIEDRHNWDGYYIRRTSTSLKEEVRIGPAEGLKMLGFPDTWVTGNSDTQSMKRLGNSVAVPVVQAIAEAILEKLNVEGAS